MAFTQTTAKLALQHRRTTDLLTRKYDAQERLIDFIKLMWHTLEPLSRPFVSGWAIEAICDHLQAVTDGHIRRLLINVPPGFSKSLTTCVFWPAWEWGPMNRPDLRYLSVSHGQHLAIRDNNKCRRLMSSRLYQQLWGKRFKFAKDQNAKTRYENNHNGFRLALATAGVTGERGDRVVIDDPQSVEQAQSEAELATAREWFATAVPSRINDPDKSAIVMIMQRLGLRDLSQMAIELGYEHLCIPMHYDPDHKFASKAYSTIGYKDPRTTPGELAAPERFTRKAVDELITSLRATGQTYAEDGQLEQNPTPKGGGMFKRVWFNLVKAAPSGRTCRGWDFASSTNATSAWTAGVKVTIGDDRKIYVEHVRRFRGRPGEVRQEFLWATTADGFDVHQSIPRDPGQAGAWQVADLVSDCHGYVVHSSPEGDTKPGRAGPFAAQAGAGNVYLVEGEWNEALLAELETFPNGAYKDQVDAISRAYGYALSMPVTSIPVTATLADLPAEDD